MNRINKMINIVKKYRKEILEIKIEISGELECNLTQPPGK